MFKLKPYKVETVFADCFIRYLLVSLVIFSSIFFIYSFIQIINEKDIVKGISGYYFAKTLLYLIPSIISTSLPFSIIFSVFFAVGELSLRGELNAIRVGGYSYGEISRTFVIFMIILTGISYFLINDIAPEYNLKSREYLRTMINRVTNINLKSGSFENISSFTIYSDKIYGNEMNKVLLFENGRTHYDSDFFIKIEAEKGIYNILKEKGISITLYDGKIYHIDKEKYHILNLGEFEEYSSFIPFEITQKDYYNPPKYLTTSELKKILKTEINGREIYKIKKEITQRRSAVVSIIIFGVISAILAFYFERDSKYFAFLSSLGIILFYYAINIFSNIIAEKNPKFTEIVFFASPFLMVVLSSYFYIFKLRNK